jgi:hypothetical protein
MFVKTTPNFVQFYHQLFSSDGVSGIDECLSAVQALVTPAMNEMLTSVFSPDDRGKSGVSSNASVEVSGPDGFGVCF